MQKRLAVLCCVLLIGARPSFGQEPIVPDQLTLSEAVRIAVERNPALAAVHFDIDIAEAVRLDTSRRLNPALTFESEGYPLAQRARPPFFDSQDLTLRVDQEIELAGRRGLRVDAADASVDAARARVDNARRLLTLDVQRAYFQVVLAAADQDVSQASLEEIDRAIGLNRSRFDEGEISGGELRRLRVERLRFVDDVFAAELAVRNARGALLALLNEPDLARPFDVTELVAPPGAVPASAAAVPSLVVLATIGADGPSLAADALTRRPDVVAAQRELVRADTDTRLQRALRTPNITVGGGYQRAFGTNAVVFGVTIPLPFSNRNQGGVARAEAARQQAGSRARAAELKVRLDVQQAVNALDVNRERVRYIETEYLGAARESRDIVFASYQLGAANLIDFLDAQRAFRDTVRTYNRALYEQRISIFELAAAMALPPARP